MDREQVNRSNQVNKHYVISNSWKLHAKSRISFIYHLTFIHHFCLTFSFLFYVTGSREGGVAATIR